MKRIFYALIMMIVAQVALAQANTATLVDVDGVITNATKNIIERAIAEAEQSGNVAVVIKLDTPGGVLDATREIVSLMLNSKVPVIVYVGDSGARAGSAGVFITLAANYAVMAESTNIGAAHPIAGDGSDVEGELGNKVLNDTIAFVKTIAEKRGRNIEVAESMVADSKSLTATEALNAKVIDKVLPSGETLQSAVVAYLGVESVTLVPFEISFTEQVLSVLSDPNILAALFFIAMLMVGLEVKLPGTFVFGGIGAIAFILFVIGSNFIPVNMISFAIILLGVALLIAEMFVTSFGVLFLSGMVAMFFGIRMMFDTVDATGIAVSHFFVFAILGTVLAVSLVIGRLIIGDLRRKNFNGMDSMVGEHAKVIEWQGNTGKVTLHGEIWDAEMQQDASIMIDDKVEVVSSEGMMLRVKKI